MQNFEQIRSHLTKSGYKVTMHEPYVACVELSLDSGNRHQAIFLSELDNDDERGYLRVHHACADHRHRCAARIGFQLAEQRGLSGRRRPGWRALSAALREPPL